MGEQEQRPFFTDGNQTERGKPENSRIATDSVAEFLPETETRF